MTRTNQPPRGGNRRTVKVPPKVAGKLKASIAKHFAPGTAFSIINPRQPQAVDPRSTSLNCLGYDIIRIIGELIWDASPQTLLSLACVSSFYYDVARYCQHRNVELKLSHQELQREMDEVAMSKKMDYIEKAGLLPAVRHITIKNWRPDTTNPDLSNLIPKMTGLTDISFDSTYGVEWLIELLQKRPKVQLHVDTWGGHGSRDNKYLAALENNLNLISLQLDRTYLGSVDCLEITQPLKRIFLTCPNLRNLKLDISQPRSGCVIPQIPREYCGMGLVNGQRPPALEELEIISYPFGVRREASHGSVGHFTFTQVGYPMMGTEVDYWAETFDWTRLRRLVIHNTQLALALMPRLTALREVVFTGNSADDSTRKFYQQVPAALESISVQTIADIGIDTLLHHGPGLRKLKIHQNELWQEDEWLNATVDKPTLQRIREGCPHLQELELDVGRNQAWRYPVLAELAAFPKVKKLTIWFELSVGPTGVLRKPLVTSSAAQELFKYIRDKSPLERSPLRKLIIHSGSTRPLGHGYPAPIAFWPSRNKATFVCTLSERDDDAGKDSYTFECVGLSTEENKYLQDLEVRSRERYKFPGELSKAVMLARNGPKPPNNDDDWF